MTRNAGTEPSIERLTIECAALRHRISETDGLICTLESGIAALFATARGMGDVQDARAVDFFADVLDDKVKLIRAALWPRPTPCQPEDTQLASSQPEPHDGNDGNDSEGAP